MRGQAYLQTESSDLTFSPLLNDLLLSMQTHAPTETAFRCKPFPEKHPITRTAGHYTPTEVQ